MLCVFLKNKSTFIPHFDAALFHAYNKSSIIAIAMCMKLVALKGDEQMYISSINFSYLVLHMSIVLLPPSLTRRSLSYIREHFKCLDSDSTVMVRRLD